MFKIWNLLTRYLQSNKYVREFKGYFFRIDKIFYLAWRVFIRKIKFDLIWNRKVFWGIIHKRFIFPLSLCSNFLVNKQFLHSEKWGILLANLSPNCFFSKWKFYSSKVLYVCIRNVCKKSIFKCIFWGEKETRKLTMALPE